MNTDCTRYLAKGLVIPVIVSSHEDHGYIVDAGPSGKHFIAKEKVFWV